MAQAGAAAQTGRHAPNRRGMTAAASGAMTAAPAAPAAMVVLAAIGPASTGTASRPPAVRGEAPRPRLAMAGGQVGARADPQAGLVARRTVTAATGRAGSARPRTTCVAS